MLSHLLTKKPKAWLRLNIHTSCLAKVVGVCWLEWKRSKGNSKNEGLRKWGSLLEVADGFCCQSGLGGISQWDLWFQGQHLALWNASRR